MRNKTLNEYRKANGPHSILNELVIQILWWESSWAFVETRGVQLMFIHHVRLELQMTCDTWKLIAINENVCLFWIARNLELTTHFDLMEIWAEKLTNCWNCWKAAAGPFPRCWRAGSRQSTFCHTDATLPRPLTTFTVLRNTKTRPVLRCLAEMRPMAARSTEPETVRATRRIRRARHRRRRRQLLFQPLRQQVPSKYSTESSPPSPPVKVKSNTLWSRKSPNVIAVSFSEEPPQPHTWPQSRNASVFFFLLVHFWHFPFTHYFFRRLERQNSIYIHIYVN